MAMSDRVHAALCNSCSSTKKGIQDRDFIEARGTSVAKAEQ
jgi:hypothetical protein